MRRSLFIFVLMLPVMLAAQTKNGYKFLGKQRYAEAAEAFAKDTSQSDPALRTAALYGLCQVFWKQPLPEKDLNKAYACLEQTARSFKKLNAAGKEAVGKYDLNTQGLSTARSGIAQERYAQLEAAPVARDIEAFLGWPELPAAVKGKAQRLLAKAGGPTKPVEPFAADKQPFHPDKKADFEAFVRSRAPSAAAEKALYNMLDHYVRLGQWDSVATLAERHKSLFPDKVAKLDKAISIAKAPESAARPVPLGQLQGNAGWPVPSADGQLLYFAASDRKDNLLAPKDDIFLAPNNGGTWGNAALVPVLSLPGSNDVPLSLSSDGNTLLLIRDGVLYTSEKAFEAWGAPQEVPEMGRHLGWIGSAQLSANGQVLLFEGCVERIHKNKNADLYVSLRDSLGQWLPPFALEGLNTDSMERSPFLHADLQTLYFSTNGRDGLGGLDLYMSRRLDGTWKNWSAPRHLGKAFNSFSDDWQFRAGADGQKGYFSETAPDGQKVLVWADLPNAYRPQPVSTLKGSVLDTDKLPLGVEILVTDLQSGQMAGRFRSDPTTGNYLLTLPVGRDYGIGFHKETYLAEMQRLDLSAVGIEPRHSVLDIQLLRIAQWKESGKGHIWPQLFFEKNSLLPSSQPSLRQLAQLVLATTETVEIVGHTDNTGSEKASKTLSEARAQAVKTALVKMGCPPERIRTVGMGRAKPAFDVAVPAENARNNRVEIILKKQ
jgi:flagellar motor protein MotB